MDVFYRIIFHLIHLEEREEGESRNFNQIFFINQKYVIRFIRTNQRTYSTARVAYTRIGKGGYLCRNVIEMYLWDNFHLFHLEVERRERFGILMKF